MHIVPYTVLTIDFFVADCYAWMTVAGVSLFEFILYSATSEKLNALMKNMTLTMRNDSYSGR